MTAPAGVRNIYIETVDFELKKNESVSLWNSGSTSVAADSIRNSVKLHNSGTQAKEKNLKIEHCRIQMLANTAQYSAVPNSTKKLSTVQYPTVL